MEAPDAVTPVGGQLCDRRLTHLRAHETSLPAASHRSRVSREDLDKMSRHSLNWDDFFGSSLDLAPSLLNIYDDIVASGTQDISNDNDVKHDDCSDHSSLPTSSASSPQPVSACQPLPASRTARGGGSDQGEPSHRAARLLPSLSQPPDRPVSMMETDHVTPSLGIDLADLKKKRPLSISSMSSTSTSSLPRMRKKRTPQSPPGCEPRTNCTAPTATAATTSQDSGSGDSGNAASLSDRDSCSDATAASGTGGTDSGAGSGCAGSGSVGVNGDGGSRAGDVHSPYSESRTSVDSGCVDADRSGERYLDSMSITSSDTSSLREEVDTSLSSVDRLSLATSTQPSKQQSQQLSPISPLLKRSSPVARRKFEPDPLTGREVGEEGGRRTPTSVCERASVLASSPLAARYKTSSPTGPQARKQPGNVARGDNHNVGGAIGKSPNLNTGRSRTASHPSSYVTSGDSNPVGSRSPDARRHPLTSSRNEARNRFFSNYEEHMKNQSNNLVQAPLAESESLMSSSCEDCLDEQGRSYTSLPTSSSSLSSSNSLPASGTNTATALSRLSATSTATASKPTATAPTARTSPKSGNYRHRPESNSSPNSHKPSTEKSARDRTSQRRTSSSRQDTAQSGQRSVFSKSSKKREQLAGGAEVVYVSYVQRVVTEIIESERTYISSLEDIIHGYLEPLEKILNAKDERDDISCLFSNIRDIYKFGCTFLADLERTGSDPVKVAQCFVKHNKGFVIYTDYCTNYPRAVEVLTKFMQHPELSELCKERQLALGHGLPLGAYLLRPVQRILKYHLLLQNIVKNCEKDVKDASILEQAFQHMTEMAHHINEMKRKHEHAVRIQEIQSQLEDYVGEDLTRLGELVLESTFRVYGAKASRQVFLFEKGLLISKKKEGGMLSCKTFIRCLNLMLVEVIPNEPLSFHVIPFDQPRAQYTLQARNMEQKRRWCQEIKRLILESFKGRIPDNVKSLVMELGRNHDDDYVTKEALDAVRKHQHMAPEYLEKRRFRKKSGSRIPDFSLLKPQRVKREWNKRAEGKSRDKLSPDRGRRAESKSPDSNRRIFSKQLATSKRRSQSTSLPSTPTQDKPYSGQFNKSNSMVSEGMSQSATQNSIAAIVSTGASLVPFTNGLGSSPAKDKLNVKKSAVSVEPDMVKRAESFRKAVRSRPLTSEDLDELVTRCGVRPYATHSSQKEGEEVENEFEKISQNLQDLSGYSLRSESDLGDSSGNEESQVDGHGASHREQDTRRGGGSVAMLDNKDDEDVDDTRPVGMVAGISFNGDKGETPMTIESRSTSLPALYNLATPNVKEETKIGNKKIDAIKSDRPCSQSSENINSHKAKGRMSRRDKQISGLQSGRYIQRNGRGVGATEKTDGIAKGKIVTAFHDTYGKRTAEKCVLKKKALRLPNTSKHLSVPNSATSIPQCAIKAKLTNWNSVDKLTKGSLNDLSHLDEDPWVMNPQMSTSTSSMDYDTGSTSTGDHSLSVTPSASSDHMSSRPRGHSDISEMRQVSSNKENLDWIVYLNRFSFSPSIDHSEVPGKRMSTSALERPLMTKEVDDLKRKISEQIPYATPPRAYMSVENMERFNSLKSTDTHSMDQNSSDKTPASVPCPTSISAFGVTPLTVTMAKPTSFTTRGVMRSHSIPVSVYGKCGFKADSRARTLSMNMDKLTDESDKMVAEMEEYISRTPSSDSMKIPSKFPTNLPVITVEDNDEERELNRLSIVSSLSTSSYESQASSSSDGLVGTLKSKLHSWAQWAGKREETESCATLSLTASDDEERAVTAHNSSPKSGNTFEPHTKKKTPWQDRNLECVLREHSLGGSLIGSRMACTVPAEPDVISSSHDSLSAEGRSHITCSLSSLETVPKTSDEQLSSPKESPPDHIRFSLPPTTEATEALMPPSLKNCDIQQSDSGFSLQSNDSIASETYLSSSDTLPDACLEISEESSKEVTPETKPKLEKPVKVSTMKRTNSCESVDSTDSFYERRLSVALDTDVFLEATPPVRACVDPVKAEPRKHTIREYVQLIEKKFKPESPKVFEVHRREPGSMIRQRLETLRENAQYRRGSSSTNSSRPASEEREFTRSKSQPPAQRLNKHNDTVQPYSNRCRDDIKINSLKRPSSKESISKSRESLHFSKSKEHISFSTESVDKKHSSPSLSFKMSKHGHESDGNRFPLSLEQENSNQFVHKARSSSQAEARPQSPSLSQLDGGLSQSACKLDQMSSEVDNLVIMKGWVRALISKFQEKP